MAANGFYFFTDASPQAPNAANYLEEQDAAQAYGPVPASDAAAGADEYRVTSLHTASFDPTAYAACDALACVQKVPNKPLVNIILKPLVQPSLNFAPVKYIVYKGVLASSLVNGTETAAAANNQLTQSVWDAQAKKNAAAGTTSNPPAGALGVDMDAAFTLTGGVHPFADAEPLDNLFYQTGRPYQLPLVRGGWSLGQFDKAGFGMEVLMDGLGFRHTLGGARNLENRISVPALDASGDALTAFEHWHDKEQVLGYMDPCAFYGSFFRAGVYARAAGNDPFVLKSGNALYNDVLFAYANKQVSYLDVRNEHGFSLNYFTNYGDFLQLSCDPANAQPSAADYYASGWPVLTLPAASFPVGNTTKARNPFRIQLPVGDNTRPLVYVSQGYRDINRRRKGFPAELKSAERFYDAFETPAGGFTKTPDKSGLTSLTFVVPNVTGQADTTPVSCYLRLKYFKQEQQQGTPAAPTVIQSSNHLDNLFYPLDLRVLFKGDSAIKSSVYDEEVYLNARDVPGLGFDFVGKVGIARDPDNTSLFLIPTDVRGDGEQASAVVTLTGETSDYSGHYPNFVALKYPLEKVVKGSLKLTATSSVPAADFVSEAAEPQFVAADFRKLFLIMVANATYDSWKAAASAALDPRFRAYLGVKNLQNGTDADGVGYTSFELVLRGFALDAAGTGYEVKEAATNVTVYTYAGD